jgi:hypothetical protein
VRDVENFYMPGRRSKEGPRPPQRNSLTPGRARQNAKIREIADAILMSGLRSLDQQAEALGLSRSTTWTLRRGMHKGSGLSVRIIARMLSAARLPLRVRRKILEYLAEKTAGLYGDTERELRRFARLLSLYGLIHK